MEKIVMAKAPSVPKAPPAPPAPKEQVLPNVVRVRHKVSGKEFNVSKGYFETYRSVLEIVD